MIDLSHALPLTKQAHLLDLSRSSLCYQPVGLSELDLALMAAVDELHLKFPFYGQRRLKDELLALGHELGREHVGTLMRRMGIEAL